MKPAIKDNISCILGVIVAIFIFHTVLDYQSKKITKESADFERRLEVSKQFELTIERMKGDGE